MSENVTEQIGNYHLIRRVGAGTYADVFEAKDIRSGRQVAIKLYRQLITIKPVQDQFMTEARLAASLKHPHIVEVFDYGVEQEKPYLVMRYAPKGSLDAVHPQGTVLPLSTIVSYVNQIAEALQYAHDVQRVIHRDIKPANVLVGAEEKLLVADFGIAEFVHSTFSWVDQTPAGTSLYMAPEQRQGQARQASDQYSLGIMVYQWLCGDFPFQGDVRTLHYHHENTPPPPLHDKVSISPAVEAVVLRALEKNPERRFPTVRDFAHALEQAHIEEILTQLNSPGYATKLLMQEHVQQIFLDYVIKNPFWYTNNGRAVIDRLRARADTQSLTELTALLSVFAKRVISNMEVVIQRGEGPIFDSLLDLAYSAAPPSSDPSVWTFLLESLSANPQTLKLVVNNWERYARVMSLWGSLSPLPYNELIHPWFPKEWTEFLRFLALRLPGEWHDIALNDLLDTTSAARLPLPIMRTIEKEYASLLESYLYRPFRSHSQQNLAVRFFTKLVESGYTKKLNLLHIMLTSDVGSRDAKNYIARVLAAAQLIEKEVPAFLERYGEDIKTYYQLPIMLNYARQYLLTFIPNDLDRPSARQLLQFMSSANQRLPPDIRMQAQNWQIISTFIDRPEINKRVLLDLARAINQLSLEARSALTDKLIVPFISCIESEVDLMCVIYTMNTIPVDPELPRLLYHMAELVGEKYRENRSEASLVPYIRIILQAEVVFHDISDAEQQEFVSNFLKALLRYADRKTYKKLNVIAQNWPTKIFDKWSNSYF